MTVSDNNPNAGETITLSATVQNQGGQRSALTTLTYRVSADSDITTGDEALGTASIAALDPSATASESFQLTIPDSNKTYWLGACVDAVTGESDSNNNCSSGVKITVPPI